MLLLTSTNIISDYFCNNIQLTPPLQSLTSEACLQMHRVCRMSSRATRVIEIASQGPGDRLEVLTLGASNDLHGISELYTKGGRRLLYCTCQEGG